MKVTIKSFVLLTIISTFLISCSNNAKNKADEKEFQKTVQMPGKTDNKIATNNYGVDIKMEKVADVSRIPSVMEGTDEKPMKVIGKIDKVCQMEGCWIDVDMGNGEILHVTFKDEAFVVPKDVAGKTVVMDGVVTKEILPVEFLKKKAKDEGKSQKEIDKITSPVIEYSYEAIGVQIHN